jgi:hypothetical protein
VYSETREQCDAARRRNVAIFDPPEKKVRRQVTFAHVDHLRATA